MADKAPAITLNQPLVAYLLGVFALLSVGFSVASWINDRTHFESATKVEIGQLREGDAVNAAASKELAGEVGRLGQSIDQLALALKEVEVIQRVSPLTGFNMTTPSLR